MPGQEVIQDFVARIRADIADFENTVNRMPSIMDRNINNLTRQTQDAFKTLNIRSSQEIEDMRNKITQAYDKIKTSGTSTSEDIRKAHAAWEAGIKTLTAEQKNLGDSSDHLNTITEHTNEVLGQIGLGGVNLGRIMSALASPIALVGGGLVALTVAGVNVISTMSDIYLRLRQVSAVSGLSAEEAHRLTEAIKLMGLSSDALNVAFFRMGAQIESGGQMLNRLGINVRDTAGQMKSEGALFLEVRDRIADIGDASQRNAALLALFGRGARELAPVFQMNREEFTAWLQKAEGLHGWSEKANEETRKYIQAVAALSAQWDALKVTIGTPVIGVVTIALEFMGKVLSGDFSAIKDAFMSLVEGAGNIGAVIGNQIGEAIGEHILEGIGLGIDKRGSSGLSDVLRDKVASAANKESLTIFSPDQMKLFQEQAAAETEIALAEISKQKAGYELLAQQRMNLESDTLKQVNAFVQQEIQARVMGVVRQLDLLREGKIQDDQSHSVEAKLTNDLLKLALEAQAKKLEGEKAVTKAIQAENKIRSDLAVAVAKDEEKATETFMKHYIELNMQAEAAVSDLRDNEYDRFVASQDRELRAFLSKLQEENMGVADAAQLRSQFEQKQATDRVRFENQYAQKIQALYQDETSTYEDQLLKELHDLEEFLQSSEERYKGYFDTIDQYAAKKTGLDKLKQEVMGLQAAIGLTGVAATQATMAAKFLSPDLVAGMSPAQADAFRNAIAQYAQVLEQQRQLKDITALVAIGFDREQAAIIAASAAGIRDREQAQQVALDSIKTVVDAQENQARRAIELTELQAKANNDMYGLISAAAQRWALDQGSIYAGVKTLVTNFADQSARTLGDLFFNVFTGQAVKMADVWRSLLNSMLRAVSDFLATQAVRSFLSLLFGGGGGFLGAGTGPVAGLGQQGLSLATGSDTGGGLLGLLSGGGGSTGGGGLLSGLTGGGGSALGGLASLAGILGVAALATGSVTGNSRLSTVGGAATLGAGLYSSYQTYLGVNVGQGTAMGGTDTIGNLGNFSSLQGITSIANVVAGLLAIAAALTNEPKLANAATLITVGTTAAALASSAAAGGLAASLGGATTALGAVSAVAPYVAAAVLAGVSAYNAVQIHSNYQNLPEGQRTGIQATVGLTNIPAFVLEKLGVIPEKDLAFFEPISALVGQLIGSFFGKPDVPHAVREALEVNHTLQLAQQESNAISKASSLGQLYEFIKSYGSTTTGGSGQQAFISLITGLPQGAITPAGQGPYSKNPNFAEIGVPNNFYPTISKDTFTKLAEQGFFNTNDFKVAIQAGVTPSKLAGANTQLGKQIVDLINALVVVNRAFNTALETTKSGLLPFLSDQEATNFLDTLKQAKQVFDTSGFDAAQKVLSDYDTKNKTILDRVNSDIQKTAGIFAQGITDALKQTTVQQGVAAFVVSVRNQMVKGISDGLIQAFTSSLFFTKAMGPALTAIRNLLDSINQAPDKVDFSKLQGQIQGILDDLGKRMQPLIPILNQILAFTAQLGGVTLNVPGVDLMGLGTSSITGSAGQGAVAPGPYINVASPVLTGSTGGWARHYASGGVVDDVPAMLMQDEFVVRRAVARRYPQQLNMLNQTGMWPDSGGGGAQPVVIQLHMDGRMISESVIKDLRRLALSGRRPISQDLITTRSRG